MEETATHDDIQLLEKSSITKRYKFDTFREVLFKQYLNQLSVHCSDISRNREFLNIIVVYDLIDRKEQKVSTPPQLKKNTIISVKFAYYYDFIIAGDQEGNVLVFKLQIIVGGFAVDFLKIVPKLHERPIFQLMIDSSDLIFTISSHHIKAHFLSSLIMTDTPQQVESYTYHQKLTAVKTHIHQDIQHLFLGLSNGDVLQMQLSINEAKNSFAHTSFEIDRSFKRYVSALDVTTDVKILAVGYTDTETQLGYLMIYYTKRQKIIFSPRKELTKHKLTHLLFFQDQSHLVIGSLDGSIQILNVKAKEILRAYSSDNIHISGVVGLFFRQDEKSFPCLLSVGQEHAITATYFGQLRENMIEYIPFIFWVELRIRQELQYKSELIEFLKSLFLGSIGIDILKKQVQTQTIIGFDLFAPLLKRVVDYDEYEMKNTNLFCAHNEVKEKLKEMFQPVKQPKKPIGKLEPLKEKQNSRQAASDMGLLADYRNKISNLTNIKNLFEMTLQSLNLSSNSEEALLESRAQKVVPDELLDEKIALFQKITNKIIVGKIQILNLSRCAFLFEEKLPFQAHIFKVINEAKQLRYLDISYNMLSIKTTSQILDNIFKDLDFLSLAHNKLGTNQDVKQQLSPNDVKKFFGGNQQISLRSNQFTDEDGETILNQVRNFSSLIILDISGNLDFGDKTLTALQRLTVTENKIKFKQRKDNKNLVQMIRNMSFLQENKIFDEEDEQNESVKLDQSLLQENIDRVKQNVENQENNVEEDCQLIQNKNIISQKEIVEEDVISRTLSISSNKSNVDISLQLLCIQMKPERCEQAMKTATDFLVQNKIPNLYIYVVDNKIDNVWESSIAKFYTRRMLAKIDNIKKCIYDLCENVFVGLISCAVEIFESIKKCLRQCLCSTFFLYKYLACCVCTFLISKIGILLVQIFGSVEQKFEVNEKTNIFEEKLQARSVPLTSFFIFNYVVFYLVVLILPAYYAFECHGLDWVGHYLYLTFAGYSIIMELTLAYICERQDISQNIYNQSNYFKGTLHVIKDLFISQLTKFDVYANLCFISVVHNCGVDVQIAYISLSILGLNFIVEATLVFKLIYDAQISKTINMIDYLCYYCSLTNITMITQYLEKWTNQSSINFLFFEDVPTKIFSTLLKLALQDFPLAILQVIFLAQNRQYHGIDILKVSLAISCCHMILSLVRFLTTSRASKIDQLIMIDEINNKCHIVHKLEDQDYTIQLNDYIRKNRERQSLLYQQTLQEHNSYVISMTGNHGNMEELHKHYTTSLSKVGFNQILPMKKSIKKGITHLIKQEDDTYTFQQNIQLDEKVSPSPTKKGSAQISDNQNLSKGYAVMNAYETQIKKWQLQGVSSIIKELILIDINRQCFSANTEWEVATEIDGRTHIIPLSLTVKILTLLTNHIKKYKEKIKILVIGVGSGYTFLALQKYAKKLNNDCDVQIVGLEHLNYLISLAKQNMRANGEETSEMRILEFDCQKSVSDFFKGSQFDLIYVGASITSKKYQKDLKNLIDLDGSIFYSEITSSEIFTSVRVVRQGDEYIETRDEIKFEKKDQFGVLLPKQLQDPQIYPSYNINYQSECALCSKELGPQAKQFINPFWDLGYCVACGLKDHNNRQDEISYFTIKSNLVYWDGIQPEALMKINTKRMGTNKQPQVGKNLSRTHDFQCNHCGGTRQSRIEDSERGPNQMRYICLGCQKEEYSTRNGFLDLCEKCAEIQINSPFDLASTDLMRKHSANHALLRIIFSNGYYKY